MSNYSVINDVSKTLKYLLWENMKSDNTIKNFISEDDITFYSPVEKKAGKLSLFLFRINENIHMKNQEIQRFDSNIAQGKSLVLDLLYLLTSNTDDIKNDHILMGKTMQILHDNTNIKGSYLQGCLAGTYEELRVLLYSIPLNEMNTLWQSFWEKAYKLSVCYEITPVFIHSERSKTIRRVISKGNQYYRIIERW